MNNKKDVNGSATLDDSPLTPPPKEKRQLMVNPNNPDDASPQQKPPVKSNFIKPLPNKVGDVVRSTEGKMPQRNIIETVDEPDDEELPEVQMYDTGKFDDSQDTSLIVMPNLEGFDNVQDSIYIMKRQSTLPVFKLMEEEKDYDDNDDRDKQKNGSGNKKDTKKSKSQEKNKKEKQEMKGKGLKTSKSMGDLKKTKKFMDNLQVIKANKKQIDINPLTVEEKRQKWIKSLPASIRHLTHLDFIKNHMITDKVKQEYYRKFNIESKDKEWVYPRTDQEKAVALELIIDHLYNNKLFRNEKLNVKGGAGGKGKTYPTSPRRGGSMFGLCNNNRQTEAPLPHMKKTTPQINPPIDSIKWLIKEAQGIFRKEPNLLEVEAPVKICGDFHGQFHDMLQMFAIMGGPPGPVKVEDTDGHLERINTTNYSDDGKNVQEEELSDGDGAQQVVQHNRYLCLGDYVDRGQNSTELICLLLAWKIKFPNHLFLLRGNHETQAITRIYGFFDEVKRRYNPPLWRSFTNMFNYMPVTALVDERILCMHGGLSPDLTQKDLSHINTRIARPCDVPDYGLMCDLLWSDPADKDQQQARRNHMRVGGMRNMPGWTDNDRGVSYKFNEQVVKQFCDKHDIDLICRAHQVVEEGYQFYAERKLVTVFSAPNYCGQFDNDASIMDVGENLCCRFIRFEQQDTRQNSEASMGQMMPSPGPLQRSLR